ncbi:hypothetical protein WJX72_004207 [[Myrmecia] bisecta]|uniref:protein-serine/threonine phosphatase n=1 Tax=[Myrmecia] bisecta TaxID=41462 RepID=A0AAW1PIX5_9CHLO
MGGYLSQPVTTKESEEGENDTYKYGVSAMQGWRTEMEDAHSVALDLDDASGAALFGVFDGHGGKSVAKFCAKYLANELTKTEAFRQGDVEHALTEVYLKMDELLVREEFRPELNELAGQSEPSDDSNSNTMLVDEAHLPDVLKKALETARQRAQAKMEDLRRSKRGESGSGKVHGDEDPDDPDFDPEAMVEVEFAKILDEADSSDEEGVEESGEDDDPLDKDKGGEESRGEEEADPPDKGKGVDRSRGEEGDGGHSLNGLELEERGKRPSGKGIASSSPSRNSNGKRARASDPGADEATETKVAPNGDVVAEPQDSSSDEEAGEDTLRGRMKAHTAAQKRKYLGPSAGCTAVVAVVKDNVLTVANAGDSRCVFSRRGEAVAMTEDHKPTQDEERQRIMKAGGFVADGRINGSLNLSRALGDMEYKQSTELPPAEQMVTAVPEVRRAVLDEGDEFLLLACDGIWDVLTNQEAITFVRERLVKGESPKQICEAVCDRCLALNTDGCGKGCDNILMGPLLRKLSQLHLLPKRGKGTSRRR